MLTVPGRLHGQLIIAGSQVEATTSIGLDSQPMSADTPRHRRPSELLREHRTEVAEIASRHGVTSLRVFGSVARNADVEGSDLDLLVTLAPGRSLFDLGALTLELRDLLGIEVDVFTPAMLRPEARSTALTEARPL